MPRKKKLEPRIYPDILNMAEARSYLRVSYGTMMELILSGQIQARKINKEWRILKRNIDDFVGRCSDDNRSEKFHVV